MSKLKYNRAFIPTKHLTCPPIVELLANTGNEELEYWIVDSKESFHGEHDDTYFYFKDSRIDAYTKLPLSCLELEFTQEELESSNG